MNEDFENSTECWICDNDFIDTDVKVRDHCHTNVKLNQKIPVVFSQPEKL